MINNSTPDWLARIKSDQETSSHYTQRDFQIHFSDERAQQGLADFMRRYSHNPMKFFQSADDWQALVPAAIQSTIAEYGQVAPLPEGLITNQSEDRDSTRKRFVWKSEGVQDYQEGQPFNETYIEGGTSLVRWRKVGAKIVSTYEASQDLPLDLVQTNVRLTQNEFRAREWRHFMHECHKATSDKFPTAATDKHGNPLGISGWQSFFDNAFFSGDPYNIQIPTFDDIKDARAKMLRPKRDAVRPDVCIINATTEADLSDDDKVNNGIILFSPDTFFRTGSLPNVYGLQFIVVPDSHFGYFEDDVARTNDDFIPTTDAFLLTVNNGPTVTRHTREPMSTEVWRIYDGQKNALNMWERYEYSTFRYTNVMRIAKTHLMADGNNGVLR